MLIYYNIYNYDDNSLCFLKSLGYSCHGAKLFTWIISFILTTVYVAGTIIKFTSKMRKLKLKEVRKLSKGHQLVRRGAGIHS